MAWNVNSSDAGRNPEAGLHGTFYDSCNVHDLIVRRTQVAQVGFTRWFRFLPAECTITPDASCKGNTIGDQQAGDPADFDGDFPQQLGV